MGELFSLAPLREDGEEGTTGRTDNNGRKGTDPQMKARVRQPPQPLDY